MPKLTYFDVYGKGEAIRMLLWKAQVPYTDERIGYGQFDALR